MKKFLAAVLVTIGIALFGCTPANATSAQTVAIVQHAPTFTSLQGDVAKSAPLNIAGASGGVKPFWYYTSCYWAMNGARYCWRYGCSAYERMVLGCYDGWYRTTIWYA